MHLPTRSPAKQQGAAAITIMLCMLGLIAILGLIEVGYLYWAKRDVQKIADLAALAGAQRLSCAPATMPTTRLRAATPWWTTLSAVS